MAHKSSKYQEAPAMYEQGMSIADVAEFYGITRQAMHDILKRRGVECRSNLRHGKDNHFYRGTKASDKAQNLLEKAMEKGVVQRQTHCQECGSTGEFKDGRTMIQAHHTDYSKPLEVMWLCQKCHHQWHKTNKARRC